MLDRCLIRRALAISIWIPAFDGCALHPIISRSDALQFWACDFLWSNQRDLAFVRKWSHLSTTSWLEPGVAVTKHRFCHSSAKERWKAPNWAAREEEEDADRKFHVPVYSRVKVKIHLLLLLLRLVFSSRCDTKQARLMTNDLFARCSTILDHVGANFLRRKSLISSCHPTVQLLGSGPRKNHT